MGDFLPIQAISAETSQETSARWGVFRVGDGWFETTTRKLQIAGEIVVIISYNRANGDDAHDNKTLPSFS